MGSQLIILVQALNVLSHDLPDDITFRAPCVHYADPLEARAWDWSTSWGDIRGLCVTQLNFSANFSLIEISLNQAASVLCPCKSAFGWLSLILLACFVSLEGYPRCLGKIGNKLLLTQTKSLQRGWVKVNRKRMAGETAGVYRNLEVLMKYLSDFVIKWCDIRIV